MNAVLIIHKKENVWGKKYLFFKGPPEPIRQSQNLKLNLNARRNHNATFATSEAIYWHYLLVQCSEVRMSLMTKLHFWSSFLII